LTVESLFYIELVVFVSDVSSIVRACAIRAEHDWTGCKEASFGSISGEVCVCDTYLCNTAPLMMSSPAGHVIMAVTLIELLLMLRLLMLLHCL